MKSAEVETTPNQESIIHDRGRGPEIRGTRITVYDVLDYALECWPPDRIAAVFDLRPEQIEAAIAHIRDHTIEVLKDYIQILERVERGHPPELQAKIDANHIRFQALVDEVNRVRERAREEIRELIQRHRAGGAKESAHADNHGGQ